MDRLEQMLKMQNDLHKKVSPHLTYEQVDNLTFDELMNWVRRIGESSIAENVEVQQECGMKWWKEENLSLDQILVKLEKVKEEVIDVVHFSLAYCVALGINHEELFERYSSKNNKNHTRNDWDCNTKENT